MPSALLRTVTGLALLTLQGGCAAVPRPVAPHAPPLPPRGMVLVVDGAGGVPVAYEVVADAVAESRSPLVVHSFEWSHGFGRGLADMTDVEHAQQQGRRLADYVRQCRCACPHFPITILAYSAGAHVALEACRWLPPNSLERLILLAPAVAADYDLRPALAAARQGVDAFTSRRDCIYLGLGPRLVGTADGKHDVPAAGRVGFDAPLGTDACLSQRLRQHPWDRSLAHSGNRGGHAGSLRPAYFRSRVLPLLP